MKSFNAGWISPSNIALVKYWGKFPVQMPSNPSVSFTLSESVTSMEIEAKENSSKDISVDFYFEGVLNEKFKTKITKFLETQIKRFPWLLEYTLKIDSKNTFPHSSGIASSASSMSALCLCLMTLDEKIANNKKSKEEFFQEASELSRLASGSAGRSVYPFLASWGDVSNSFASPIKQQDIHPTFHDYCDSILIVDAGEKSVSSRVGHALMENHPFKEARFMRARENLTKLLGAMKKGDMTTFIDIVEEEALMLHALMMTSTPSYILLKPMSLTLIEKIRELRFTQNIPVCFTIDAGPNIHLLYPRAHKEVVQSWIEKEFSSLKVIHDKVGMGPKEIHEPR